MTGLQDYKCKENWAGGGMQSDDKLLTIYRLSWAASLTIVLIGVAVVVAVRADEISGTVAKVEPPTKPDGTLAHPYADVNQCPPGTDIAIWPEEWHSIPNIPSVFSVCFVGGQSKNNNGGGLEVRGR
jgi:hypothetical protein